MAALLYFGSLPDQLGRMSEEVELPVDVHDVQSLLNWLGKRGELWGQVMTPDGVQVTINKEFTAPDSPVANTDEIAIISIGLTR